jgi:hypothetical protein
MAMACVSSGNTSLTVRYAELAPAEAKKKMIDQEMVCVTAFSTPCTKSHPVMSSSTPEKT